jgi:amicyanin
MLRIFSLSLVALLPLVSSSHAEDAAIKLFQFQPKEISVTAGTEITWTNGDDIEHSVTAGTPGKESNAFDSRFFKKEGQFTFIFQEPGTYDYFCKRHPSMKGKVVVTE